MPPQHRTRLPLTMESRSSTFSTSDIFWQLCYSHYLYPAFLAAVSSHISSALTRKPVSVASIARASKLPKDAVTALLPTLVLFGIAGQTRDGDVVESKTDRSWEPDGWRPMFDRHINSDPHVSLQMRLFHQSAKQKNAQFWKRQLHSGTSCRRFFASLDAHSRATAVIVAREVKKTRKPHLVDVGCGAGTYTLEALRKNADLQATVVDFAPVLKALEESNESKSFHDRLSFTPVNALTQPWPTGAGVYLLSHFLQDFGERDRERILRRARQAISSDGEVWIHGHFWSDNRITSTHASFSFYLYTRLGGALLSTAQQIAECNRAGLRLIRSVNTSRTQQLFVFVSQ